MPTGMTLRVYRLDDEGRVVSDSGTRTFESAGEKGTATSVVGVVKPGFPPCTCPHCRRTR